MFGDLAPWITMADALGWEPGDPRARGRMWPWERPATAVAGDPRLSDPGYRVNEPQFAPDAIRLVASEALLLQSFRPDYPVRGSKSKRFEQIGNAVPPRLAQHVLAAVTGVAA